ncbi:MAG: hypothetical protein IPJ97_03725 [Proteobacteria bacterium]|nr:hypothetical protein [Pseudomonadota bacterium]
MRVPGFAREFAATQRHQPIVIVHFVFNPERTGVNEDGLQFVVQSEPAEQQQARLRGDRRADLVGDHKPVATDELLLGKERDDEPFEPTGKVPRQRSRDWNVARDGGTQWLGQGLAEGDSPPAPAQEGWHQQAREHREGDRQDGSDRGAHVLFSRRLSSVARRA